MYVVCPYLYYLNAYDSTVKKEEESKREGAYEHVNIKPRCLFLQKFLLPAISFIAIYVRARRVRAYTGQTKTHPPFRYTKPPPECIVRKSIRTLDIYTRGASDRFVGGIHGWAAAAAACV